MCRQNKLTDDYFQKNFHSIKPWPDVNHNFGVDLARLTNNCIWVIDTQGCFHAVHGRIEKILQISAKEAKGKPLYHFFTLEDGSSLQPLLQNIIHEQQEIFDCPLCRVSEEGEKTHFQFSALPYYDHDNQYLGHRGIIRDITTMVQIQKSLEQSNKKLENKNIALREILSRVESEKNEIYHNLAANIEKFIKPLLRSLTTSPKLDSGQQKTIETIEQLLNRLNWDFYKKIDHLNICLTPAELQVCRLLQAGHSLKEIANIQSISLETAKTHCKNIRRKVGLKGQKTSLASFFQQL